MDWHPYCHCAFSFLTMEKTGANRYRFNCQVVEVIRRGEDRMIKLVTDPGSMIIEIPFARPVKLGERLVLTGDLVITSAEEDCLDETIIDNN